MATKVAASRTVSTTTAAMAIASRASRACDVCASKGARWYCGADAAYLCDRCDTQVHTANSLAQRHERVRLTPAGIPIQKPPRKTPESTTRVTKTATTATKKKSGVRSAPPQVLPARKRTRTSRPHPHRRTDAKPDTTANAHVKVEDSSNLFADFFHTEDFLIDHPQEVPSLLTDGTPSRAPSVSETGSERGSEWGSELGSEWGSEWGSEIQEYSPSTSSLSPGSPASEDSFAVYFKGKAAHQALEDDDVITSTDQFGHLVPESNSPGGIDIICCDADGNISLAGDACFIPGDIPGLDVFDDCSLSFDLALRGASEAFEGETTAAGGILASKNWNAAEISDQYVNGPFAKYFVTKKPPKTATTARWSPEIIKSEAREILRCCTEPGDAANVPTLRLNYEEIITAWSGRGEPWVSAPELCNATIDVGLVPDMEACDHGADDGSSCGGREARVLRYKEKRRSRLFSKTIRYEVRKLNADRRPRMKGRFVKRPTNTGPMIS